MITQCFICREPVDTDDDALELRGAFVRVGAPEEAQNRDLLDGELHGHAHGECARQDPRITGERMIDITTGAGVDPEWGRITPAGPRPSPAPHPCRFCAAAGPAPDEYYTLQPAWIPHDGVDVLAPLTMSRQGLMDAYNADNLGPFAYACATCIATLSACDSRDERDALLRAIELRRGDGLSH